MKQALFRGCGTAIVTPFTKDGVDFATFEKLLDAQLKGGVDAIIACGTTGEPSTMNDEEHVSVAAFAVKYLAGRLPVIAGIGGNNTAHCIELAHRMQKIGANGLLAVTPYYNKTTQMGLVAHFEAIAGATELPLVLYNVPPRTGLNINPETLDRLADHPRIVAIKEASADITQITEMMRRCHDRLAFYAGNDDHVLPLLALGAQGVISVASNVIPRHMRDLVHFYFDGDLEGSRALQFQVNPLARALFLEVNPIPVKTALHVMGYDAGLLRLPLVPMQPDMREMLMCAMRGLHLI